MVYNQLKQNDRTKVGDKSTPTYRGAIFREGQEIKGQVMDIRGNQITLRLSNGEVLQARLNGNLPYNIGDDVSLLVEKTSGGLLVLSNNTSEGQQGDEAIKTLLSQLNIKPSKAAEEAVKELMSQKMPLDEKTLRLIMSEQTKFPEATTRQIVFLHKAMIPVTRASLSELAYLEKAESTLLNRVGAVVTHLSDSLSAMQGKGALSENNQPILESLISLSGASQEEVTYFKEINELIRNLSPQNSRVAEGTNAMEGVQGKDLNTIPDVKAFYVPSSVTTLSDALASQSFNALGTRIAHYFADNIPVDGLSPNQEIFVKGLPDLEQFELKNFLQLLDQQLITKDQLRTFLVDLREAMVKNSVTKGMLMGKETLVDKASMTRYYQDLLGKMEILTRLESRLEGSLTKEVAEEAKQVKGTVEFLNAINQNYNILHLPMYLGDKLLNSELYIMNDKEALKNLKRPVTALIRLDLLNLGHMDIYVKKHQKNVEIQFLMTQSDAMDLIREEAYKLHKMLNASGFNTLSIQVKPLQEAFDVVADFLDKKDNSRDISRYAFDMRA